MINKKFILIFVSLVLLVGNVSALGTCELGKEEYNKGETAGFVCTCTKVPEENQEGYFLWQLNNGTILRNESTNSLNCIDNIFVDSYTFDFVNETGTVEFVTESSAWGDPDDIILDDYSVTSAGIYDCIIQNIELSQSINLGEIGAARFDVIDASSGSPLVGARCTSDIYDASGLPLLNEPYGIGSPGRTTYSEGEVGFQRKFDESIWNTNTTYIAEFHCYCTDSNGDTICYTQDDGQPTEFKACTIRSEFSTNGNDYRQLNDPGFLPGILIIIPLIMAAIFMAGVFFVGREHWPLQIGLFILSCFSVFGSIWWGLQMLDKYFNIPPLSESITYYVYVFGLVIFGIIIYFLTFIFGKLNQGMSKGK